MKLKHVFQTGRCVTVEVETGEIFRLEGEYEIYVNGEYYEKSDKVITTIYGLKPETDYEIKVVKEGVSATLLIRTDYEFVTLNVKDFGAKGDGVHDDTIFIQAAILSCPKDSRVLIPEGTYRISSLFLKDQIKIELEKNAVLSAFTDRSKFPILKGMISSQDETSEYNLGTWEGNPLPMFSGIITGIHVHDVVIYGQGVIEGNASAQEGNWWHETKTKIGAFRPRMIYLNGCSRITVQGITVQNSPSWNIHPYFSEDLRFLDLKILNPKDSPNTDGLNPESCNRVEITGVYFSLGDDCIAVKSGKIYMGKTYKRPSENITVRQCCMRDGHGSVTIGSEMAGGVRNLTVRDCLFLNTDRGLRIKTRRGRGEDAIVDGILFEHIKMDHVMTPFVINSFYFCDPDGHTDYVRSKEKLPVDHRTPNIKSLTFRNIEAKNCHVAAAFLYGLPEQKIKRVEMEKIHITYADQPRADVPAMMEDMTPRTRQGIYANQIETLILKDITVDGQEGRAIETANIDSYTCTGS